MASDSQKKAKDKRGRSQREKWGEQEDDDRSRSKRDKADRRARDQARRWKEQGGDE